jgi:hypothetical protein
MAHILAPTRGLVSRDNVDSQFIVKRTADELRNLVESTVILALHVDGDAYVLEATADYTPQILARHAQETLTALVAQGYLTPRERSAFEVHVSPVQKATKDRPFDPGAIAITRESPDPYRLAGSAATTAHEKLMADAQSVPSVATTRKYRAALAEAQIMERWTPGPTDTTDAAHEEIRSSVV